MTLNCNSLNTTKEQLINFIREITAIREPVAILLQETYMDQRQLMQLKIPGYIPLTASSRTARDQTRCRGSVILLSNRATAIPLPERSKSEIELIGIRLKQHDDRTFAKPVDIWSLYCPPDNKELDELHTILKRFNFNNTESEIIIAGDFNVNITPGTITNSAKLRDYILDLNADEEIHLATDFTPTRRTPFHRANKSVLDFALTTIDESFAKPVLTHLSSDHYPVVVGFRANKRKKPKTLRKDKYRRDKEMKNILKTKCLSLQSNTNDLNPQQLAENIISIWEDTAKIKEPIKKKGMKQFSWWNESIQSKIEEKDKLINKLDGSVEDNHKLSQIEEELQKEIWEAKNKNFRDYASNLDHLNNHTVFHAIKNIGTQPPPQITTLAIKTKNGKLETEPKRKAEILAKRYKRPLGEDPKRPKKRREMIRKYIKDKEREASQSTNFSPFTQAEAIAARKEMSNNKSPGASRIKKEDFEVATPEIDKLVTDLANKICTTGVWPKKLKKQIVCPIPKNKTIQNMINEDQTRPISLLEVLDKWVEKMVYNRISPEIEYQENQIGYQRGCEEHTTTFSEHIAARPSEYNLVVLTDISKAFDSVPLDELKYAVWKSNIPQVFKKPICSFIEDREFQVQLTHRDGTVTLSKTTDQIYGTPQGSNLGPMLWNLFFDPILEELTKISPKQQWNTFDKVTPLDLAFADDLTLLASSKNPKAAEKFLERKLKKLKELLDERGMQLSPTKVKTMCIQKPNTKYEPSIRINGTLIQVVKEARFLGVIYDNLFSFIPHVQYLQKTITLRLRPLTMLRSASWGPTQATTIALYQSYTESVVRNSMMAWFPHIETHLKDKLDVTLRRSIRVAIGLPMRTKIEALMLEAGIDSSVQLAAKCAVSLYIQINPMNNETTSLSKKMFHCNTPIWVQKCLKRVPRDIWEGKVQTMKKKLLAHDKIKVILSSIKSQSEAEKIENQHSHLLYTDASVSQAKNQRGQASTGYIWYEKDNNQSWKPSKKGTTLIGHQHSSYSAEAAALTEALLNSPIDLADDNVNLGIFTDSLSNLATLDRGVCDAPEQRDLFQTIVDTDLRATFYHTKSHIGILKNEEVDQLCNISDQTQGRQIANKPGLRTKSQIKEWTKQWAKKERHRALVNAKRRSINDTGNTKKNMLEILGDNIRPPPQHKHLPRKIGILMSKIRTNRWTEGKSFLKNIQAIDTKESTCDSCAPEEETTQHIINECTQYFEKRQLMLAKLKRKYKNVTDMLCTTIENEIKLLSDFLIEIQEHKLEQRVERRIRSNNH